MLKQTELQTKQMSLAAELRIIRKLRAKKLKQARSARKYYGDPSHPEVTEPQATFDSLHNHAHGRLKHLARMVNIAYGLLKGREYKQIEEHYREGNWPDWLEVKAHLQRFGYKHHPKHNVIQIEIAKYQAIARSESSALSAKTVLALKQPEEIAE